MGKSNYMVRTVYLYLFLVVSYMAGAQVREASHAPASDNMVLYNCNVVDTDSGRILEGQTVKIVNGVIEKIAPSRKKIRKGEVDLSGKYIMPGMIDSHTHWGTFAHDSTVAADLSAEYLKCGVTTVRDLGSNILNIKNHLKHVEAGDYIGPDVYYSSFWVTGNYPIADDDCKGWNGERNACPWSRKFSVKDSTDAAIEKAVIEAKEAGCSGFKIYINFSKQELDRMIPIMKKHNMKVWGHASQYDGAKAIDVANSGVEVVSHAYLLSDIFQHRESLTDEEQMYVRKVCKCLKNNGIILDITAHISLEADMAFTVGIVKDVYKEGVKFVVGTDYFGCAVPDEIKKLQQCGISNLDILRAATVTGAEVLGKNGELGIIAKGAEADIIVLPGNPIEDLSVLDRIEVTILDGKKGYVAGAPFPVNKITEKKSKTL